MANNQPADEAFLQEDQAPGLVAVFALFTALPIIAVASRIVARRAAGLPLWWDDWLLVLSLAVVVAHCVFLNEAIRYGLGKHIAAVPKEDLPSFQIWVFATELYYPIVVTCVKCSILFLYIRLFRVKDRFVKACYALIGLCLAWGIAVLFSAIFQCKPVAATWDRSITGAECINLRSWLLGTNIPNIMMDVLIILLPVPLVLKLKLSLPRKLGLCGIFSMAFASTIISILRVHSNATIDLKDETWSYGPLSIYSTVEGSVGIIAASVPIIGPLFRACLGRGRVTTSLTRSGHVGLDSHPSGSIVDGKSRHSVSMGYGKHSAIQPSDDDIVPLGVRTTAGSSDRPPPMEWPEYGKEGAPAPALGGINVHHDVRIDTTVARAL